MENERDYAQLFLRSGRYAAALDPQTPAGGPSSPNGAGLATVLRYAQLEAASGARSVRIRSGYFERGQQMSGFKDTGQFLAQIAGSLQMRERSARRVSNADQESQARKLLNRKCPNTAPPGDEPEKT